MQILQSLSLGGVCRSGFGIQLVKGAMERDRIRTPDPVCGFQQLLK
jgi:hypothetical protein